ncbi:helix-turn-helix domain-containing protein [Kitasatospora sp. NPDC056076]|uniref:helix-turn-helix domain-containing protein n=1 Tax=Kitasatospora sp. NPDC056076 TaxID=3345703 RepID=UPI0035DF1EC3
MTKAFAITTADLARLLKLSPQAINHRFGGRSDWSPADMDRIGQLIGIDPAELVRGPDSWFQRLLANGQHAAIRQRLDDLPAHGDTTDDKDQQQ